MCSWLAPCRGCCPRLHPIQFTFLQAVVVAATQPTLVDADLASAQQYALMAYLKSESSAGSGSSVRTCTNKSLCTFWSGEDPFEAERVCPVLHRGFLSTAEIASCHDAAAACGRQRDKKAPGTVCPALEHEWYDMVYSDEHVACYLHRNGIFASQYAELRSKLYNAAAAAHAGLSPPDVALHVRCIELHAYAPGGALLEAGHTDNGSMRTLIVQLSDASAFEGGRFVTWHEGAAVKHELQAGDALLIHSDKMHNVSRVTSGMRHSLVVELWNGPDNDLDRFS